MTPAGGCPHVPQVTGVGTGDSAILGLLPLRAAPAVPALTELFYPTQVGIAAGAGTASVPCEDVPSAPLTCPPPLPVPAGTMGGCFSKPKPGEGPLRRPAVPAAEVGQRWTLAGGNVNARLLQGGLLGS